MSRMLFGSLLLVAGWFGSAGPAHAQGLIRNLPADGTSVRYEGTYSQTQFRPNSATGDVTIDWIRHLTIKSVGSEMVEWNGETVPARWIEIKVVTGMSKDGALEPGPTGNRIYKVLVPESKVIDKTADGEGILVSYLPIVKGYKKFGDGPVTEINAPGLQVYPTISLLMHYRELIEDEAAADPPQVTVGSDSLKKFSAQMIMESRTNRSTNDATIWSSPDVPFGLAAWTVKMVREEKASNEPRSAFQPVSEATEQMTLVGEPETGAESEIMTP